MCVIESIINDMNWRKGKVSFSSAKKRQKWMVLLSFLFVNKLVYKWERKIKQQIQTEPIINKCRFVNDEKCQ